MKDLGMAKSNAWSGIGKAAIGVGTGLLGMVGQRRREKRAMANQRSLMKEQMNNQWALNKQGAELQYDMWKKTNYPAQVEMLKEAGLNPAIIYGQGGAGGATTGGQGGGSAAGGQAPAPQPMLMEDMVQAAMTAAQIELAKSQAKKNEAEADSIRGEEGTVGEAQINKLSKELQSLSAQIKSEESKQAVMEADRWIKEKELDKLTEEINILANDRTISDRTRNATINRIINEAIYSEIKNRAEEADIKLTEEETNRAWHQIRQEWVKTGLQGIQTIIGAVFGKMGLNKMGKSKGNNSPLSEKAKRALMEY